MGDEGLIVDISGYWVITHSWLLGGYYWTLIAQQGVISQLLGIISVCELLMSCCFIIGY